MDKTLFVGRQCVRSTTPQVFTPAGGLHGSLGSRETTAAAVGALASPPGSLAGCRPRGGTEVAARVPAEPRLAGLTHLTTHWSRRATVGIGGWRGAVHCGPLLTAGVRRPKSERKTAPET